MLEQLWRIVSRDWRLETFPILTQDLLDVTGSYNASLAGFAVRLIVAQAVDIHGVTFRLG